MLTPTHVTWEGRDSEGKRKIHRLSDAEKAGSGQCRAGPGGEVTPEWRARGGGACTESPPGMLSTVGRQCSLPGSFEDAGESSVARAELRQRGKERPVTGARRATQDVGFCAEWDREPLTGPKESGIQMNM